MLIYMAWINEATNLKSLRQLTKNQQFEIFDYCRIELMQVNQLDKFLPIKSVIKKIG
jgi:hypothetical protein